MAFATLAVLPAFAHPQDTILKNEGLLFGDKLPPSHGRSIFTNRNILSLQSFLNSYRSADAEEQNAAYAFLLGVVDATEGKEWCSYRVLKTISILETLAMEFKDFDPSRYDERAAYVITEVLKKYHPCKGH
ncbi:MAG: hypothetical protein LBT71_09390 [Azoarcus sp.]|nr:hypothetical protein [Azoarcus sp.]